MVGNGHMDRRVLPQLHRIARALIVAVYDGLPAVFRRHDDSDVRPACAVRIHDVDFRRRLVLLPLCRGQNRDFVRALRHRFCGRFGRGLLRRLCRRLSRRFVRGLSRRLFRRLSRRLFGRHCRGFFARLFGRLHSRFFRCFFRRFSRFRLPIGFFCFLHRMISIPAFAHVFVLHSFLYDRFARYAFRFDRQHRSAQRPRRAPASKRASPFYFSKESSPRCSSCSSCFSLFCGGLPARKSSSSSGVSRILRTT